MQQAGSSVEHPMCCDNSSDDEDGAVAVAPAVVAAAAVPVAPAAPAVQAAAAVPVAPAAQAAAAAPAGVKAARRAKAADVAAKAKAPRQAAGAAGKTAKPKAPRQAAGAAGKTAKKADVAAKPKVPSPPAMKNIPVFHEHIGMSNKECCDKFGFILIWVGIGFWSTPEKHTKDQPDIDSVIVDAPEIACAPSTYYNLSTPEVGGFGAINWAGAMHSALSRLLNEVLLAAVMMSGTFSHQVYICTYFDRLRFQVAGQSASAEALHRDISAPNSFTRVFGGWFNMNPVDGGSQWFACVPGSWMEPSKASGAGFATIKDPEEAKKQNALLRKIEVKPGWLLQFDETTVHIVVPTNLKRGYSLRKHVSIQIATSADVEPIHGREELERVIEEQDSPLLKSKQVARSYPMLYTSYRKLTDAVNYILAIGKFAAGVVWNVPFKEHSQAGQQGLSAQRPGTMVNGVFYARFPSIKSMVAYGWKMLPDYSAPEKAVFYPAQEFLLRTVDSLDKRMLVRMDGSVHEAPAT